jgi:predicted dehydrogenase
MKRIGLLGCGTVASYGHLPTIKSTDGLELTAIYDPDPAQLEAARKKFDVPHAFGEVQPFAAAELDAFVITSPAPYHLENLAEIAPAGKAVLCEKPLAMTAAEALRMRDIASEAQIKLYTAFDYRFSAAAQQIKRLVEEDAIGTVRSLRLIYVWNCHGKYERDRWNERVEQARRRGRMLEGGPLVDCGVHQVDLARWWLGSDAVRWSGSGAWVDEYEAPDHLWLHMDHQCGAHTCVEISYSFCHTAAEPIQHFSYELIGTGGLIRYDRGLELLEVRGREGTRVLDFAEVKNFAGMYEAYRDALETGEDGELPTAQDGLAATKIARSATEQAVRERRHESLWDDRFPG